LTDLTAKCEGHFYGSVPSILEILNLVKVPENLKILRIQAVSMLSSNSLPFSGEFMVSWVPMGQIMGFAV
jgi:hypothetical protein